jgi:hypothetical protein
MLKTIFFRLHRLGAIGARDCTGNLRIRCIAAQEREKQTVTKVRIMVREVGELKPEYSLDFDLPEIPSPGSYISIQRPNAFGDHGEDLIVDQVWWRLQLDEAGIGSIKMIFVECVQAIGPWSSDRWRDTLEAQRKRGKEVPELKVARFGAREDSAKGNA